MSGNCVIVCLFFLYAPTSIDRGHLVFGPSIYPSICPPLQGRHCEVRVSVHLVCMGLRSIHLVFIGLGISGVKKSTCGVALNKEQFHPKSSSPKSLSVCLSAKIFTLTL